LNLSSLIKIIDITNKPEYKRLLIDCIIHRKKEVPLEQLQKDNERYDYLETAIPKGLHMKVLFYKGDHIGMIEFGPPEASGLPIYGENIIVMNCIWVHSRAKGNNFGKLLVKDMMESEQQATGFATIGLEDYWMHWLKKGMIERLGFHSVRSIRLKHKMYKKDRCFTIHLMWLPTAVNVPTPTWDEVRLLKGVNSCKYHPLYWGKYGCAKKGLREIYEKC